MRSFKTKALCLLSSAVLLCGASSMTANAANGIVGSTPRVPAVTVFSAGNYYLDKTNIEIESGKTAVINAKKSSSFTLPANSTVSYQWYKNGSALSGETKSYLTVSAAGTYYCEVTVKQKVTIYVGVKKQTAYKTKTYTTGNATVTVYEKLQITEQSGDRMINSSTGFIGVSVSVKGGKAPYTYEWTRNGEKYGVNSSQVAACYAGTYKCKITDSRGTTVTSRNINVSYEPLKFSKDFPEWISYANNFKDLSVIGGTGKYTYDWYVWDCATAEWKDKNLHTLNGGDVWVQGDPYIITGYNDFNGRFFGYSYYKCVVKSVDTKGNVVATIEGYTKKQW
ncbi:immunoglobulin domain-containing protein [Ruminococcus flavefaciens]|uniref:Ig-like domain-containing protein n=1 Tax=Ruminococcus flavefaciens TaxID=1265 RepID=A0A1M7JPG3_RUMFL|nr:immunoglobulin domain-containing protein [Ruminococcus flavefaciens]SHM54603.1 hypothetical protein SAMN04487860_106125 [Ruminococcus flavefaciens]